MLLSPFCLAESQTSGGETSKGENKPQPGEPEDSPATATGKGHNAQRSALSVGGGVGERNCRLTSCFCPRKQLGAEWRKPRSSSTRSSSCRAPSQEKRRKLTEAVQTRNTPSRRASPAACRERPGSWDLTGKARGSEQHWMHRLLLAFPVQTLRIPRPSEGDRQVVPPPALCFSAGPPDSFSSCCYKGPGTDYARLLSVQIGVVEMRHTLPRSPPSNPTKSPGVSPRANQSASHCGGPGQHDQHTVTPELLITLRCRERVFFFRGFLEYTKRQDQLKVETGGGTADIRVSSTWAPAFCQSC